jgi:acetyltransferase
MTNGGGAGVMAADALALGAGTLATFSPETMARLDQVLPPTWSHGNPVDIIGDAPAERYVTTLQIICADPHNDAVLFMHAPTAIVPSETIAAACAPIAKTAERLVLSCWLGDQAVAGARKLHAAGSPIGTPEEACARFSS